MCDCCGPDCAFHFVRFVPWDAPFRVSYWIPVFFAFDLYNVMKQSVQQVPGPEQWWQLLYTIGNQFLFLLTILFHELGHGCMARRLGGSVSHVLFLIVGGVCFTLWPRDYFYQRERILKLDFAVALAGPMTHFPQAAVWALLLWLLHLIFGTYDVPNPYMNGIMIAQSVTGYPTALDAIIACVNPLGPGLNLSGVIQTQGMWEALPWAWVGNAIRLNAFLFLFNILCPIYPSDAPKLLVTIVTWCCGLPARTVSLILLCLSVSTSVGILYVAFEMSWGGLDPLTCLLGYVGVISLMEAKSILYLRFEGKLFQHRLFPTARSWLRGQHYVGSMAMAEVDDPAEANWGPCCPCCPQFSQSRPGAAAQEPLLLPPTQQSMPSAGQSASSNQQPAPPVGPQQPVVPGEQRLRQQRGDFLSAMEQRQADERRTVRELTR